MVICPFRDSEQVEKLVENVVDDGEGNTRVEHVVKTSFKSAECVGVFCPFFDETGTPVCSRK